LGTPPFGADALHVRVRRDDGRWVVTDVYLHGKELTAESMRRGISVPRIEAHLNRPGAPDPGSADDDGSRSRSCAAVHDCSPRRDARSEPQA
jgi:hypothetical protein